MWGISEHQFFCQVFELLRETEYYVLMKGIDFPTGPRKDFIHQILFNHLAGKDGITSDYLSIGVLASVGDREKVAELEQAVKREGRLWVGYVPEPILAGYMIMDGEIAYAWNQTRSTPYEPERDIVHLRKIFTTDRVIGRWQKEFYELAEQTRLSKLLKAKILWSGTSLDSLLSPENHS